MANSTKKATSKPVARKSPAKRPTAKRTVAKKAAARKSPPKSPLTDPFTESARQQMIAEAAYYLAEKRGFSGGDPVNDWIAAEAEIDTRLGREGRA